MVWSPRLPWTARAAISLTVENVHSIAQLPLTGGAGIAFMVVIAALLGTAGVIVVVRSRRNMTV